MIYDLRKISDKAPPLDPETARDELWDLAVALDRDKFWVVAAAISRHLIDGVTLDEAFGLKRIGRGSPTQRKTLERDTRVLQSRLAGMSWKQIADETGMDDRTARRLCKREEKYENRYDAALVEILTKRLDESGG